MNPSLCPNIPRKNHIIVALDIIRDIFLLICIDDGVDVVVGYVEIVVGIEKLLNLTLASTAAVALALVLAFEQL